jgi:predicted Zn-dependent peptidase
MSIDRTKAPEPSAPRPYQFPRITRTTLPNGLRLLISENHNAPLVSLRALIRSGADHDTFQTAGLASITADVLDEGAGDRDAARSAPVRIGMRRTCRSTCFRAQPIRPSRSSATSPRAPRFLPTGSSAFAPSG